jgi:hypothetical protein
MELIVTSLSGFFTALLWQFFTELFRREPRREPRRDRRPSDVSARRALRLEGEAACYGGL